MHLPPTMNDEWNLKLKAGKWMVPVRIVKRGDRLEMHFKYNKALLEEVQQMEGAKWHGYDQENPRKIWTIADSQRNRFQLCYLAFPDPNDPKNPYKPYDGPLVEHKPSRKVYSHQLLLICEGLTRHYCIFAAEMGTGKTLAAIEVMEASKVWDWIWVGPRSALNAVQLEFVKWKAKVTPLFMTYEGLKKYLMSWPKDKKPPQGVIFDESSRGKNPTSQRSQAMQHLADAIRNEYGRNGYVIEMSGSPAPKSPLDWWKQCEVAQPGYIREGSIEKFKKRLAIIEQRETFEGGGVYPHLVTWKDDENKCDICGLLKDAETHTTQEAIDLAAKLEREGGVDVFEQQQTSTCHIFKPSKNEVAYLYKRMSGLVTVLFKKDCLDLPDKIYKEIICKPTKSILNAASAIQAKSPTTIKALTLLRELSDGFQYINTPSGVSVCDLCNGSKQINEPYDENEPDNFPTPEEIEAGYRFVYDDEGYIQYDSNSKPVKGPLIRIASRTVPCSSCKGTGNCVKYVRETRQVACPKDDALRDIIDQHDDVGRLVVYGGFTGSIDRIVEIFRSQGWDYIRVDGRGWFSNMQGDSLELLRKFQTVDVTNPRVGFIAQAGSAGMGVTLTASPTITYYSNDFNAESRIQSEDRIHRIGMDVQKGATIIDLIHLPTDLLILNNLKKKRRLQDLSMGQLKIMLENASQEPTGERAL